MTKPKYHYEYRFLGPSPIREVVGVYGEPRFDEKRSVTVPVHYHWRVLLECDHVIANIPLSRYGGLADYINETRTEPPYVEETYPCDQCRPRAKVRITPPPPPRHYHVKCPECNRSAICEHEPHDSECLYELYQAVENAAIEYDYDSCTTTAVFSRMIKMLTREQLEELLR